MAQYKEREEVKQKLQVFSAKKLWIEAQAGEEKASQIKAAVKSAKIHSDNMKEQCNLLIKAQEQIQRKKMELREACLDKVMVVAPPISLYISKSFVFFLITDSFTRQGCVWKKRYNKRNWCIEAKNSGKPMSIGG